MTPPGVSKDLVGGFQVELSALVVPLRGASHGPHGGLAPLDLRAEPPAVWRFGQVVGHQTNRVMENGQLI